MIPVSATIITLNEAHRIADAVRALDFCDEVLVVDSGSHDLTCEIAARHGARVLHRSWTGYADQKNFAAENARNDWVFNVDADERPSPGLRDEIVEWQKATDTPRIAWSMPRLTEYLGAWVRHSGWYPDRKVRLYDRRHSRWEGNFVHESLRVDGPVGSFQRDLLHFPFRSVEDHYERIDRYTRLAAKAAEENGRRFSAARLAVAPPVAFLRILFLRAGFLDGWRGLRIAYMGARYVYLREARISR